MACAWPAWQRRGGVTPSGCWSARPGWRGGWLVRQLVRRQRLQRGSGEVLVVAGQPRRGDASPARAAATASHASRAQHAARRSSAMPASARPPWPTKSRARSPHGPRAWCWSAARPRGWCAGALQAQACPHRRASWSLGVPFGRLIGGVWDGLPVVTKAGGFGGPDTLLDAVRALGCFIPGTHMTSQLPILAITMGDAGGIGPEIIAKALGHAEVYATSRPLVIGERRAMEAAVRITGVPLSVRTVTDPTIAGTDSVDHRPARPEQHRHRTRRARSSQRRGRSGWLRVPRGSRAAGARGQRGRDCDGAVEQGSAQRSRLGSASATPSSWPALPACPRSQSP